MHHRREISEGREGEEEEGEGGRIQMDRSVATDEGEKEGYQRGKRDCENRRESEKETTRDKGEWRDHEEKGISYVRRSKVDRRIRESEGRK